MNYLILSIGCWISVQRIYAQAIHWNGGNGDWNVLSNWSCNCVPGITDSVTILAGSVTIPAGVPVFTELILISSGSTLINHDTLTIANVSAEGIIVEGVFENNGKLLITEAFSTGLKIEGTVINTGIIQIDSIDGVAIGMLDSAMLTNAGLIDIVAYYNRYGLYDESGCMIVNTPEGEMFIYGGYPFASAINLNGLMINEGLIDVYRGDVAGLGKWMNQGLFLMDHPTDDTEQGISFRHIENSTDAIISVQHTSSWAFVFNDTIINHELIDVSNTFTDAFNIAGTYVLNHGTISIDSCGRYGMLTGTNTVLRNETNAVIKVSNAVGAGLRIERIEFYNNGLVELDTVGSNLSTATDHGIECIINGRMLRKGSEMIIHSPALLRIE